jgi:hypothetical protein
VLLFSPELTAHLSKNTILAKIEMLSYINGHEKEVFLLIVESFWQRCRSEMIRTDEKRQKTAEI